jgi:hypothetical protein
MPTELETALRLRYRTPEQAVRALGLDANILHGGLAELNGLSPEEYARRFVQRGMARDAEPTDYGQSQQASDPVDDLHADPAIAEILRQCLDLDPQQQDQLLEELHNLRSGNAPAAATDEPSAQ